MSDESVNEVKKLLRIQKNRFYLYSGVIEMPEYEAIIAKELAHQIENLKSKNPIQDAAENLLKDQDALNKDLENVMKYFVQKPL